MIFASLGTMDMPFLRMAEAVDRWAATSGEEVVVQTGHTKYSYQNAKAFNFCTKDEMREYIERADVLILQGGWGAISEAMELHKRIVAMPRNNGTEHIHDQYQLIHKLDDAGCVIGVFDENDLAAAIERARTYEFRYIKRGNAEIIIKQKLKEWF